LETTILREQAAAAAAPIARHCSMAQTASMSVSICWCIGRPPSAAGHLRPLAAPAGEVCPLRCPGQGRAAAAALLRRRYRCASTTARAHGCVLAQQMLTAAADARVRRRRHAF